MFFVRVYVAGLHWKSVLLSGLPAEKLQLQLQLQLQSEHFHQDGAYRL